MHRIRLNLKLACFLLVALICIQITAGTEIVFEDEHLERMVRHQVRRPWGPLYAEDVLPLTVLDASESRIESLGGIESLLNLRELSLGNNRIEDITPLSSLVLLEELDLRGNTLQDITGLENLIGLRRLTIQDNQVENIEPLQHLSNLEYLSIHSNRVSDISPLGHLVYLQELSLRNNMIETIIPLSSLTIIRSLNLRDNRISNFSPLAGLENIRGAGSRLNLGGNHSTDFEPVTPYYNYIEDVDFILLPPAGERAVPVIINEIMASNGTVLADEDGDFPSWLELYNAGSVPVDLTGRYLSDDSENLLRWQFPDIPGMNILNPGEYMVIFASGKDKSFTEHHTNFRISRDGEPVILTDSDGLTIIDYVPEVVLQRNESYGRLEENLEQWRRFGSFVDREYAGTTPGTGNSKGIQKIQFPVFSSPGGFSQHDFSLGINHPDSEVMILYTLDGSIPSPENLDNQGEEYFINYFYFDSWTESQNIPRRNQTFLYEHPIGIEDRTSRANDLAEIITTYRGIESSSYLWEPPAVNVFKGNVVRARACKMDDGKLLLSDINTNSYFIHPSGHELYSLPVLSLVTGADNIFGYETGIYVPGKIYFDGGGTESDFPGNIGNLMESGDEWERNIHVEIFENTGEPAISQNVGMRMHGGFARQLPQKSFRLYARDDYDENDDMYYPFFTGETKKISDEPLERFKRILFRQGGNWYNFLNDVLAHKIMDGSQVGVQRCRRFIHFINGEYWGLINARDRIDEYHLAYNYDIDPDNIIILHGPDSPTLSIGSYKLEAGYPEDVLFYNQFHSFALENDLNVPDNYSEIEQMLSIDSYIDYYVIFVYFANRDWYGHRHFRYWRVRDTSELPYQDGKWRIMVWDFDVAGQYYDYDLLSNALDPEGDGDEYSFMEGRRTELLRNMLESDTFRFRFLNRFADHINTTFTPDRMKQFINEEYDILAVEMNDHRDRWHRNVANQFYLNRWTEFSDLRPSYQRQHLMEHFNLAGVAAVTLDVSDYQKGHLRMNTVQIKEGTAGVSAEPYPWTGIYFQGIPVEIEAVPAPGCRFAGWEGIDSDEAEVTLLLEEDIQVTAIFEIDPNNPGIEIPDEHLRYEIYWVLGKEPGDNILKSDMETITILDLRDYRVRNLEGLQYAVNLQELNLRDNGITNAILANMNFHLLIPLEHLWSLNLRGNELTFLGSSLPLRNLVQLEFLSVRDNQISDISALQYLVNLKDLNARNNRITDVTPLSTLTQLRGVGSRLYLDGNQGLWDYTSLLSFYFDIETVDFQILNPRPHVIAEGSYVFNYWSAISPPAVYPEKMLFLQSGVNDPPLEEEMTGPYYVYPYEYHIDDLDKIGYPYDLTGRTRINGLYDEGIAFINSGQGRDLGAAVLALDTRGITSIEVTWLGGTVTPNSRVYNIRLQYRVGYEGAFQDVLDNGIPVEYQRSSQAGDAVVKGPVQLPPETVNQAYVQLRWKYYFTGERLTEEHGRRDQLRLDNITVTGQKYTMAEGWSIYE